MGEPRTPPEGGWAPAAVPCPTCPYRRDVPPGVWHPSEYRKLAGYDGDVPDHVTAGAFALFFCHLRDGRLCAGWVGCHDMGSMLAVRLHARKVNLDAVYGYVSPVPLFASGADAAAHGMSGVENQPPEAVAAADKLLEIRARRKARDRRARKRGTP